MKRGSRINLIVCCVIWEHLTATPYFRHLSCSYFKFRRRSHTCVNGEISSLTGLENEGEERREVSTRCLSWMGRLVHYYQPFMCRRNSWRTCKNRQNHGRVSVQKNISPARLLLVSQWSRRGWLKFEQRVEQSPQWGEIWWIYGRFMFFFPLGEWTHILVLWLHSGLCLTVPCLDWSQGSCRLQAGVVKVLSAVMEKSRRGGKFCPDIHPFQF